MVCHGCVTVGETLLPERSKLFKSHWSNQWLTSDIQLGNFTETNNDSPSMSREIKRAFIAAPMSGLSSDKEYQESRATVLALVDHLCENYGLNAKDVYYAGKHIDSQSEFSDVTLALSADLSALDDADVFILYYPEKVASSVLVEAGYALARQKPMILLPKNIEDLPYFFKQASVASPEGGKIPLIKICEYKTNTKLLGKIDAVFQDMFSKREFVQIG